MAISVRWAEAKDTDHRPMTQTPPQQRRSRPNAHGADAEKPGAGSEPPPRRQGGEPPGPPPAEGGKDRVARSSRPDASEQGDGGPLK